MNLKKILTQFQKTTYAYIHATPQPRGGSEKLIFKVVEIQFSFSWIDCLTKVKNPGCPTVYS